MKKDKMEAKIGKKISRFMKFMMGVTISFELATYGVIASNHFSFKMWGLSLLLSFVLAFIISVALPVHKLADAAADKFKFKFMKKISSAFVMNLFFAFIITTVLVCVMLTMANRDISSKIDELKENLTGVEAGIKECEGKLEGLDEYTREYKDVNTQYSKLKDTQKELKDRVKKLEADKPSIVKTLPKSLIVSFLLSFVLSLVLEPLYMLLARKRYIPRPSIDDLE